MISCYRVIDISVYRYRDIIMLSWYRYIGLSLYDGITMLSSYRVIIMPLCCHVLVLWPGRIIVIPCYHDIDLSCYRHIGLSVYHGIITLSCYRVIDISIYRATAHRHPQKERKKHTQPNNLAFSCYRVIFKSLALSKCAAS